MGDSLEDKSLPIRDETLLAANLEFSSMEPAARGGAAAAAALYNREDREELFRLSGSTLGNDSASVRDRNGGLSMKEYEEQLSSLRKENLNLKLRIYFMEESAGFSAVPQEKENIYRVNIDLKVQGEELKKEVAEKQLLLTEAATAIQMLERKHSRKTNQLEAELGQQRSENQLLAEQLTSANTQLVSLNEEKRELLAQQGLCSTCRRERGGVSSSNPNNTDSPKLTEESRFLYAEAFGSMNFGHRPASKDGSANASPMSVEKEYSEIHHNENLGTNENELAGAENIEQNWNYLQECADRSCQADLSPQPANLTPGDLLLLDQANIQIQQLKSELEKRNTDILALIALITKLKSALSGSPHSTGFTADKSVGGVSEGDFHHYAGDGGGLENVDDLVSNSAILIEDMVQSSTAAATEQKKQLDEALLRCQDLEQIILSNSEQRQQLVEDSAVLQNQLSEAVSLVAASKTRIASLDARAQKLAADLASRDTQLKKAYACIQGFVAENQQLKTDLGAALEREKLAEQRQTASANTATGGANINETAAGDVSELDVILQKLAVINKSAAGEEGGVGNHGDIGGDEENGENLVERYNLLRKCMKVNSYVIQLLVRRMSELADFLQHLLDNNDQSFNCSSSFRFDFAENLQNSIDQSRILSDSILEASDVLSGGKNPGVGDIAKLSAALVSKFGTPHNNNSLRNRSLRGDTAASPSNNGRKTNLFLVPSTPTRDTTTAVAAVGNILPTPAATSTTTATASAGGNILPTPAATSTTTTTASAGGNILPTPTATSTTTTTASVGGNVLPTPTATSTTTTGTNTDWAPPNEREYQSLLVDLREHVRLRREAEERLAEAEERLTGAEQRLAESAAEKTSLLQRLEGVEARVGGEEGLSVVNTGKQEQRCEVQPVLPAGCPGNGGKKVKSGLPVPCGKIASWTAGESKLRRQQSMSDEEECQPRRISTGAKVFGSRKLCTKKGAASCKTAGEDEWSEPDKEESRRRIGLKIGTESGLVLEGIGPNYSEGENSAWERQKRERGRREEGERLVVQLEEVTTRNHQLDREKHKLEKEVKKYSADLKTAETLIRELNSELKKIKKRHNSGVGKASEARRESSDRETQPSSDVIENQPGNSAKTNLSEQKMSMAANKNELEDDADERRCGQQQRGPSIESVLAELETLHREKAELTAELTTLTHTVERLQEKEKKGDSITTGTQTLRESRTEIHSQAQNIGQDQGKTVKSLASQDKENVGGITRQSTEKIQEKGVGVLRRRSGLSAVDLNAPSPGVMSLPGLHLGKLPANPGDQQQRHLLGNCCDSKAQLSKVLSERDLARIRLAEMDETLRRTEEKLNSYRNKKKKFEESVSLQLRKTRSVMQKTKENLEKVHIEQD